MLRAYLVDDEELAIRRLRRMLEESGAVMVVGSSTDPAEAAKEIPKISPDVLFLDIQMPEMSGFDLLNRLAGDPVVVFTTAYDQYALRAFEVNSVDYLLKPIEKERLEKTLGKLERIHSGREPRPDTAALLETLRATLEASVPAYPTRISSRIGDHVHFIELAAVTHIFAKEKFTLAATAEKEFIIDYTITDLEAKLDPRMFLRVHRSTLVNVNFVSELYPWFGGRMLLRLKDPKKTEVTVARDRVKELKDRLGL
jgi:two-component system, LytTR family, response regulator